MSNYQTLNPVPSTDPRDLDDNATVLDLLVNGPNDFYLDRQGVQRKSWAKIEADAVNVTNPNLIALQGLTGAADKGIRFTGVGAMATYDLTSLGRTLAGLANAAAGRTALNLGTAATANTGTVGNVVPFLDGANTWGAGQWIGGQAVPPTAAGLLQVQSTQGTFQFVSQSAVNIIASTNFDTTTAQPLQVLCGNNFAPFSDNNITCGAPSNLWSVVWAGSGTISVSDARLKTDLRNLTAAERDAAIALSKNIGIYKWLASVQEKGEEVARNHIGMTVQSAINIMESFGLDPFAYGFICYDEWEAAGEIAAGNRYSFRYDQLNLMIAAGISARLEKLESAE